MLTINHNTHLGDHISIFFSHVASVGGNQLPKESTKTLKLRGPFLTSLASKSLKLTELLCRGVIHSSETGLNGLSLGWLRRWWQWWGANVHVIQGWVELSWAPWLHQRPLKRGRLGDRFKGCYLGPGHPKHVGRVCIWNSVVECASYHYCPTL